MRLTAQYNLHCRCIFNNNILGHLKNLFRFFIVKPKKERDREPSGGGRR